MARRFAFLLVRDFTLSPLSLFIDTLRLRPDQPARFWCAVPSPVR